MSVQISSGAFCQLIKGCCAASDSGRNRDAGCRAKQEPERIALPLAKNAGRRDKCRDGLLFPPERGQLSTKRRVRKGLF